MNQKHVTDNKLAVYALLREGDKVLLQKRQNTGFGDGCYSLPAGHVENGESLRAAMMREALEEIGVMIEPQDAQLAIVLHRKTPTGNYVDFFFEIRKWSGSPQIKEPEKCSELRFFPANNLPPETLDYVASTISNIGQGLREDYMGWAA